MKWSLCSTGYRDKPIEYVLNRVKELGMAGVEIWTGHADEYAARCGSLDGLVRELREAGLAVPAVAAYTRFSGQVEGRDEQSEIEHALKLAVGLGSPMVRTFLGHLPSREAAPERKTEAAEALRRALETADRYGVNIGLELHNNTYADTIEAIRSILDEVRHPRLRLIFDGFNLFLEQVDQLEALAQFYPWIDHVHMKNYRWDFTSRENCIPTTLFEGDVDNRGVLRYLRDRGYGGFISLEYFGPQGEKCVIDSMRLLRAEDH